MSEVDSTATEETEGQVEVTQTADDQGTESEQEEGSQESPEVEVVHAGDEGSPPEKSNLGIRKRINKLNDKVNAAEQEASQSTDALAVERERNRILNIALEQSRSGGNEAPKPPDSLDFVDGAADPQFVAAQNEYNTGIINAAVQKQMATLQQNQDSRLSVAEDDRELEIRQTKHYERAESLGVKDYADTEDAVISTLGRENVNHLIRVNDNSEALLYYLGKNLDKAAHFAELIKTQPVKAVFELGTLAAGLKVQPKAHQNPAPDPDNDLEGVSPTSTSDYETRLDKLRAKVAETGDMSPLIAFKKKHREGATT